MLRIVLIEKILKLLNDFFKSDNLRPCKMGHENSYLWFFNPKIYNITN